MNNQETAVTILRNNLPTIEALIRMNSPMGISEDTIKSKALEELSHFQMLSMQKPDILECEPLSILLAVKQVIKKNLSLDPSQGLVYTMVGSVKTKNGQWVKVLETPETANGKLSVARQCGRVLDIKRPIIKYDANGQTESVTIEFLVPSVPSPRWEVILFDKNHFKKWAMASHKKNSRTWTQNSGKPQPNNETLNYANALYKSWNGGIDPEFASTKAIRHSLSKLGTNINETSVAYSLNPDTHSLNSTNIIPTTSIINTEMANKEVVEEKESVESNYTQYEEINSQTSQEANNIKIPDVNDL